MIIENDPYIKQGVRELIDGSTKLGTWPCQWIKPAENLVAPFVLAFRRGFKLEAKAAMRIHVTADERYELFLDGVRIGRGSERGEPNHWFFETYDLDLEAGDHLLAARVWAQGTGRAYAQMSAGFGLLVSPQAPEQQALLGTGVAEWEVKKLDGYTFINPMSTWGTGDNVMIDGAKVDPSFASPGGAGWEKAVVSYPGMSAEYWRDQENIQQMLTPAILPPMLEKERFIGTVRHVANLPGDETAMIPFLEADHLGAEASAWQQLLNERTALTIPANTSRRILIDLDDYYCAYQRLIISGGKGSTVRLHWQEALYEKEGDGFGRKGNRNDIFGKHFATLWWNKDGVGDLFKPAGDTHRLYEPLWWQAGRYVEVVVKTAEEPLVIEQLSFLETRYPLENESIFKTSDREMTDVVPIMFRGLQMCSHETYLDCPFYEQLAYVGDARLESLVTFVTTHDDRLPRKSLRMFDLSRMASGFTQSRYPSRARQIIPPFTLWWVCMVHDYAMWRGDKKFVRDLMPGVRHALDAFRRYEQPSGLIGALPGWNYVDWIKSWPEGVPPDGAHGVSASINWQVVLAAQSAARLEEWMDEPELAARNRSWAKKLTEKLEEKFWDKDRGLYADDFAHEQFSMHPQCLALISGTASPDRVQQLLPGLMKESPLQEPSIYFRYYLFEALASQGRAAEILPHLDLWLNLRKLGFKTPYEGETPFTTRSDCHAWSAHPLFHYFASFVGIRPGSFGFDEIVVRPDLAKLGWAEGEMPHPRGVIKFRLEENADSLSGWMEIPQGTTGKLHFGGQEQALSGRTTISLTRKN